MHDRREYTFNTDHHITIVVENENITMEIIDNRKLFPKSNEISFPIEDIIVVVVTEPKVTFFGKRFYGEIQIVCEFYSNVYIPYADDEYEEAQQFQIDIHSIMNEQSKTSKQSSIRENSPADEIRKCKDLLDKGIINQEEFELMKKRIIDL